MSRIALFSFAVVISLSAASFAEERNDGRERYQKPQPRVENDVRDALHKRTYDVYVAEPVPEVMYRLEYRYFETRSQPATDWAIFTVSDNYDIIDDGIFFIAIHLIAEWRVTEYEPSLQWEHVGSYESHDTASYIADQWREDGFLTRIEMSYDGPMVEIDELLVLPEAGF